MPKSSTVHTEYMYIKILSIMVDCLACACYHVCFLSCHHSQHISPRSKWKQIKLCKKWPGISLPAENTSDLILAVDKLIVRKHLSYFGSNKNTETFKTEHGWKSVSIRVLNKAQQASFRNPFRLYYSKILLYIASNLLASNCLRNTIRNFRNS